MKKLKVVSLLLASALVLCAMPVKAESLSEAKQKKAEIQSSLDEANALVNSLKESKKSKENKIEAISKEITDLEKESQVAEGELDDLNSDIEDISERIAKAKECLESRQSDMAIRIIYSYENGRFNLLNAIFSSKNIAELLSALQYSVDIAKYDKEVMEEYEQALQVLSEETDALAKKQEDAKRIVSENDERLEAITALKTAQEGELSGVEGELTDAVEIAKVYELEIQAQEEVLSAIQSAIAAEKEEARLAALEEQAKKEAEAAKQEEEDKKEEQEETNTEEEVDSEEGIVDGETDESAEATPEPTPTPTPAPTPTPQPSSNNASGFTWPCPASRRITSEFGPRKSPTAGASTNHKGIDIGAPTGSAIVAAQAGKVILSQYSNSAGNYIIVSHGVNKAGKLVCTVYMHASERLVSVGQKVKKGQTIAKVGSTGYSTGPHLHFGVSEDGTYVSPWNYL